MIRAIKNRLNPAYLFFAIAISMSFRLAETISVDQMARNQAQAHETHMKNFEGKDVIEDGDYETLHRIRNVLEKALGSVT